MKLSEFSRQAKFVPKSLGNDKLPPDDQFYVLINSLNNTDTFELNAVMLRSKALHDEANALPQNEVEIDDIENPGQKKKVLVDSAERALKKQDAALVVINGFGKVAVKYCELHNLKDANDQPLTINDLANYPVMAETIVEIMTHILGISQVNEDDEKN